MLSPHFTPAELPFREPQIKEISQILAVALKKQKPDNIFVYGKTGTGKTTVTQKVLKQLIDFAISKGLPITGTYVNCRNHNKKYRALLKIVKDFYPDENFLGFSASFVYEKLLDYVKKQNSLIIVLDEIDKVKDLDELVYSLSRANDEVKSGNITIIGISNDLTFKDRLDPRTKSSLCEQEMVFPPYNAVELKEILRQRTTNAFRENTVEESALNLASAICAHESGDARTAVMLLLRAGEISDRKKKTKITDEEVKKAKIKVEEEIILNMIATLPRQQQLVLLAISSLSLQDKGIKKITGVLEQGVLFSGEVYEEYTRIAKKLSEDTVSSRWYREYISELEMYGLIHTTASGKGIRGQTRLIKLGFDPQKIREAIEKEIMA